MADSGSVGHIQYSQALIPIPFVLSAELVEVSKYRSTVAPSFDSAQDEWGVRVETLLCTGGQTSINSQKTIASAPTMLAVEQH